MLHRKTLRATVFCWDSSTGFLRKHVNKISFTGLVRLTVFLRGSEKQHETNKMPTKTEQNVNILSTSVVGILSFVRNRLFSSWLPENVSAHKLAKSNHQNAAFIKQICISPTGWEKHPLVSTGKYITMWFDGEFITRTLFKCMHVHVYVYMYTLCICFFFYSYTSLSIHSFAILCFSCVDFSLLQASWLEDVAACRRSCKLCLQEETWTSAQTFGERAALGLVSLTHGLGCWQPPKT